MRKILVLLQCSLLVFACKTSKDSGANTRSQMGDKEVSQGDENQKDKQYGELTKELKDASKDFVEKSPEKSDLKDVAKGIANQDDKELEDKLKSPELEKILNEAEKQTGGSKDKDHTISYIGLAVASLSVIGILGGCLGYRKSSSTNKRYGNPGDLTDKAQTGKSISKGAMVAGGIGVVLGGVLVAVNEGMQQLAEDSSSPRAQYIQALNRIGKELSELRERDNLHLAGSLNPCKPSREQTRPKTIDNYDDWQESL